MTIKKGTQRVGQRERGMAERRASGEQTDVICNPKAAEEDVHCVAAQSCLESSRITCSIHQIYTIEASFKLKI